jgi:hypothetical protein
MAPVTGRPFGRRQGLMSTVNFDTTATSLAFEGLNSPCRMPRSGVPVAS